LSKRNRQREKSDRGQEKGRRNIFQETLSQNFSLVESTAGLLEGEEAAENLGDSDLVELTPYDMKVVGLADDAVVVYLRRYRA